MDQFDQRTVTGPCPVCGAAAEEREWGEFLNVRLRSEKHKVVGVSATPLICTRCGNVQLFVNPQDFHQGVVSEPEPAE